jgi:glyoxylase-like metal-dependent hydrolase (beta-lactamase superfamily II)
LFAAEPTGDVVAKEPWGRIEKLADGVWAIVSTPLEAKDFTTICNGGIIAGKERVLVVEGFGSPRGAAWSATHARELTGRRPTDVVISHYHGDHANGIAGFASGGEAPRVWTTPTTHELLKPAGGNDGRGGHEQRAAMLAASQALDEASSTEIDLGGRKVTLHPRAGHTASDVTVEIDDPSIVFYGDLLWNRMVPNYKDTAPTAFEASIRAALRERETIYVPGHGALANAGDVERLLSVLGEIEAAARQAWQEEITAVEAAADFRLSESLGEWTMFNPSYFEVAIGAWHRELAQTQR